MDSALTQRVLLLASKHSKSVGASSIIHARHSTHSVGVIEFESDRSGGG